MSCAGEDKSQFKNIFKSSKNYEDNNDNRKSRTRPSHVATGQSTQNRVSPGMWRLSSVPLLAKKEVYQPLSHKKQIRKPWFDSATHEANKHGLRPPIAKTVPRNKASANCSGERQIVIWMLFLFNNFLQL